MKIGRHSLDSQSPAYVIAEIGINHEGDPEACIALVEAAARAGANAIKLQTSDPDENYPPSHPSYALYSKARLSREGTASAFAAAHQLGVDAFTTTGFTDLDWIERLDPVAYKISSGLITHLPLISKLASMGRPLLISTGMSDVAEVDVAIKTAQASGNHNLVVMQCTSLYPAPIDTVSLRSISWMAERYGICGGFSDHTRDVFVPALAVTSGARVVEKHFSLDPEQPGFDHRISLNPAEFKEMTSLIRMAEAARGKPQKELHPAQRKVALEMRRGLVAKRDIPAGATISEADLALMRPMDGVQPIGYSEIGRIVGRPACRTIAKWSSITYDSVS